jgi:hypothetical protein
VAARAAVAKAAVLWGEARALAVWAPAVREEVVRAAEARARHS